MSDRLSTFRDMWRRMRHTPAPPAPVKTEAPARVAFILFGGGAHGASQAGALSVLVGAGIRPDVIYGISAGALNAAYWACDPTSERALALEDVWRHTTTSDVLGNVRWRAAVSAVTNRGTLYDAEGLRRIAARHLGPLTFADLRLPLGILTVNVTRGEPVIFEHGSLAQAVLASVAIPGIFPPSVIDGEYYVDGSLAEWAACEAALAGGARTIYLLGTGMVVGRDPKLGTLLGLIERSWEVSGSYKMRAYVESLRLAGAEVILVQPEIAATGPLDFTKSEKLIQAGRIAARKVLSERQDRASAAS
jgi:NTE family protein